MENRRPQRTWKVWQLVVGLLLVVGGTVGFILAVSGVFNDPKAEISAEYLCGENCDGEYIELSPAEYSSLIDEKKSFVVFVDQDGCTTADTLEGYVRDFAATRGFKVFRMMFSDVKKTSLYDFVKYYPSVAVMSNGKVIGWLRADADEDAAAYNNYDDFLGWVEGCLK